MGFWPVVLNVLKNSDIVLLIADARMPELTKNREIIAKTENMRKQVIFVFNKIDLVSQKDLEKIRKEYPDAFFVSGSKKRGIKKLKKFLEDFSAERTKATRVGIVGYPNTGKSTIINLLAPEAKAKISAVSGTTKKTQWIRTGKLRIMDSPGVIPLGDRKVQVGLTASKDPHKIRDPEKVAIRIIEFLNKKDKSILKKYYSAEGDSAYEVFLNIGEKKGFKIKGGEIDENRTAIKVIDDWQKGKISLR